MTKNSFIAKCLRIWRNLFKIYLCSCLEALIQVPWNMSRSKEPKTWIAFNLLNLPREILSHFQQIWVLDAFSLKRQFSDRREKNNHPPKSVKLLRVSFFLLKQQFFDRQKIVRKKTILDGQLTTIHLNLLNFSGWVSFC